MNRQLRDDQLEAIAAVRASYKQGLRRMCLMAPTGWGKTILAASVIEHNLRIGRRTTFVVDGIGLIEQTVIRLYEEGITDVGVIQGDHHMKDFSKPVQIASVQTLTKRNIKPEADCVIIDECHVLYQFHKDWLLDPAFGNTLFVGLSATPYTKGLGDYFQTLIPAGTTQEMITKGVLCPPRVFSCGHPDLKRRLKKIKVVAGEYQRGELSETMQDKELTGNVVDEWMRKWGQGKGKTLVFGVDRVHAQSLQKRFEYAGIPCGYQDGDTPEHSGMNRYSGEFEVGRDEIKSKFHSGEFEVVCSVGTMTKGIDWDVRCISLARPTKSPTLFKQIVGRGLRTAAGKSHCVVLDHGLCTQELGFVTDIECDELHVSRDANGKPNKPKKFVIKYAKECPRCHAFRPPTKRTCEQCGFEATPQTSWIETTDQLDEVDRSTLPKNKKQEPTRRDKERFYAECMQYGITHQKKSTFAAAKFKTKYGGWPPKSWAFTVTPLPTSPEVYSWIRASNIRWAKSQRNPRNGGSHQPDFVR